MASLVTLDQAKLQLRISLTDTNYDDDIEMKMEEATAIVLDYLKQSPTESGWESGSPGSPGGGSPSDDQAFTVVQSAVLLVLGHLWTHRGDEPDPTGPITPAVVSLLMRRRDPALA